MPLPVCSSWIVKEKNAMTAESSSNTPTQCHPVFFLSLGGGGCSSVSRAGHLVIVRLLVFPQLHVEVSLSKILNPKLLLISSWCLAWQPPPSGYECVHVNGWSIVKCFERSVDRKSTIKMQDHARPFTVFSSQKKNQWLQRSNFDTEVTNKFELWITLRISLQHCNVLLGNLGCWRSCGDHLTHSIQMFSPC